MVLCFKHCKRISTSKSKKSIDAKWKTKASLANLTLFFYLRNFAVRDINMHSISAFVCHAKIHLGQMIDSHMSVISFQIYSMVVGSMCIVTEADQILISPKFVQIL